MENDDETFPDEKEALAKEFKELEEIKAREAKSRAVVLEILGDIPDADIKPPKNVLFVCKLNPVTDENDLKIIFSRFGTVNKCDIIKDYVTGDSLQYAFIEFESEDSCNEAYFKMQNVLIDDRRIHVDFCQSVSGFWKKYMNNQTFAKKNSTGGRGSYRHDDRRKYEHRHRNDQYYYKHDKRDEYRREHRKGRSHSRDRYSRRSRSHDRRGHRRY